MQASLGGSSNSLVGRHSASALTSASMGSGTPAPGPQSPSLATSDCRSKSGGHQQRSQKRKKLQLQQQDADGRRRHQPQQPPQPCLGNGIVDPVHVVHHRHDCLNKCDSVASTLTTEFLLDDNCNGQLMRILLDRDGGGSSSKSPDSVVTTTTPTTVGSSVGGSGGAGAGDYSQLDRVCVEHRNGTVVSAAAAAAAADSSFRRSKGWWWRWLGRPTSSSNHSYSYCSCPRLFCACLVLVLITVITALYFAASTRSYARPNLRTGPKLATESRCFSMCEPDDLLYREDKLMKPTIIHDGIKPTKFFLYLYPPEPKFGPEVGQPLYLTPYLKRGEVTEAREMARVKGLQWPELESYAGFLTISEKFNSHLYFWFFPSQSDPSKDPVILWLQGGPGATSLFGLFRENGPINAYVNSATGEPEAKLNPYSWNRNASMLYVDNPVGTGFSWTGTLDGYPNYVNESSDDLFIALQQFFSIWHDYADRDFYLFGESYGGKYVPALCHRIHLSKTSAEHAGRVDINLKGIGIGNGWMSPGDQGKYAKYLFYHGLLDGEQYLTLLELEDNLLRKIEQGEWWDSWLASDHQLHFILQSLNFSSLYDLTRGQYAPKVMDFWHYMQQPNVRRAMNLGNSSMSDGLEIYKAMIEDTMQSVATELEEAMDHYKVLIYHGALDIICHFPGAQEMLAKLNWTGKEEFHASPREATWFYNEETTQRELSGYVKGRGNLKLMLIRNAGHSAPMDQPQWVLRMVENFIQETL